ncbi:succinate-acetate transporter protein [Rahnella sp. BIGb0236]|uniref:DUF4153 domain-containing protein n=1 Tax=Rahnella sp. BIGb0236 TaxID=2485117 RepID=UPI00105BEF8B|nr:DUF4153 domain-containing protein [Rahnella sp. BIGb0236]TDS95804.1 succinate-acetate transporter protein [Rahnella sp. BIGb0236]
MSQFNRAGRAMPHLPVPARWVIFAICLLQGLLLHYFFSDLAPVGFASFSHNIYGQTMALTLPVLISLSVTHLNDRRFWGGMALLTLLLAGMAAWAKSNISGTTTDSVMMPFNLSLVLLVFFVLPWLQVQAFPAESRYRYANLSACYSQNTLCALLTLLMMLLAIGVMALCAALFRVIGIEYFHELFFDTPLFMNLVYGVLLGISIVTCRTQPALMNTTRNVIRFILKGLLPLVAFVALIFLFALPFTGLTVLSQAWSAASLLTTMALSILLLVNVVRETDHAEKPYPRAIRLLVNAAILLLPVYAALALYATGLRVSQYGWTPQRLWAVLVIIVTLVAALCYSFSVIDKRPDWLPRITQFNKPLSLLVVILLIAANSPLLDPYRISVNSQIARLDSGKTLAKDVDLKMLRFDTGRRGNEALVKLQQHPAFTGDPRLLVILKNMISQTSRWGAYSDKDSAALTKSYRVEDAKKMIVLAKGATSPDDGWWNTLPQLEQYTNTLRDCLSLHGACIVNTLDLNGDKQKEIFLCNTLDSASANCRIYVRHDAKWAQAGELYLYDDKEKPALNAALRNGEVKPVPRKWADIQINGKRRVIHYNLSEE